MKKQAINLAASAKPEKAKRKGKFKKACRVDTSWPTITEGGKRALRLAGRKVVE